MRSALFARLVVALSCLQLLNISADRLMRLLNVVSRNLLKADKWPAGIVHSDHPGPAVDLAAQYGLPADLDLDTPPELAFPTPSKPLNSVILSGGGALFAPQESKDPFLSVSSSIPPSVSRSPLFPEIPPPYVRDYTAEAEAALLEVTPEDPELNDILKNQGYKAMERRAREHRRNDERRRMRKLFRANYEHYAAVARTKNIERAAETLLAQRQAAEKAAVAQTAAAQTAAEGCPLLLAGWVLSPTPPKSPSLLQPPTLSPPVRPPPPDLLGLGSGHDFTGCGKNRLRDGFVSGHQL